MSSSLSLDLSLEEKLQPDYQNYREKVKQLIPIGEVDKCQNRSSRNRVKYFT